MNRYRFYTDADDWRPVTWPPAGPFWCTGQGDGFSVVVAFAPDMPTLLAQWPEAKEITVQENMPVEFSGRFPKPKWWPLDGAAPKEIGNV